MAAIYIETTAVDYLLTWNCKHIANADRLPSIYSVLRGEGFDPVVAEIHAIRKALLDDCRGDLAEYRRRTRERQLASGRQIIRAPLRKRPEPPDAREREKVSRNG